VIRRTIRQLARMAEGTLVAERTGEQQEIAGVSTDSRDILPGSLFVPLIGSNFDGHRFASESVRKGAAAVMWQKDHGDPPPGVPAVVVDDTLAALQRLAAAYRRELGVRVVGITGSNGKTTTKDMVCALLGTRYRVHKTEGNLNNHIGLPLTLLRMPADAEIAVVEMGMSGRGEISLLAGIARPDVAVVTNIGEAHLMQLGSREEIARAKLEIVDGLAADGRLVVNGDEPLIEQVLEERRREGLLPASVRIIRFGLSADNDVYPFDVAMRGKETAFSLNIYPDREFRMPLLGRHNAVNAAAAAAVGRYFQLEADDAAAGFAQLRLTGMRVEVVECANGLTVLNDAYNASPTSMRAALELLAELSGYSARIAVLGDMLELGAEERRLHEDIGREIDPRRIDYVLTYGPLARHLADAASETFGPERVLTFDDKTELIRRIRTLAGPGAVVLVKGSRGMKLEEVVYSLKEADPEC